MAPNQGLASESRAGVKKDKTRFSLVFCANATGTSRMHAWIIGNSHTLSDGLKELAQITFKYGVQIHFRLRLLHHHATISEGQIRLSTRTKPFERLLEHTYTHFRYRLDV